MNATNQELKQKFQDAQQEVEILKDLLQNRMPVGCIAETTYQPVLDENETLKEEVEELREEIASLENSNEELETKNEKNLERNQDLKGFRSVCDSLSLPELTDDCLMEYLKEEDKAGAELDRVWRKEIAELKEENKRLKKQIADDDILFQDCN